MPIWGVFFTLRWRKTDKPGYASFCVLEDPYSSVPSTEQVHTCVEETVRNGRHTHCYSKKVLTTEILEQIGMPFAFFHQELSWSMCRLYPKRGLNDASYAQHPNFTNRDAEVCLCAVAMKSQALRVCFTGNLSR